MSGNEYAVTAYPHVSVADLFIFAVYSGGHYKMTAVTLKDAESSTTPSTPIDRYVSVPKDVIVLDAKNVSAMWDGTFMSACPTKTGAGDGYEVKEVAVDCSTTTVETGASSCQDCTAAAGF